MYQLPVVNTPRVPGFFEVVNHPECLFHQIPTVPQFVRTATFPHPSPKKWGTNVVHGGPSRWPLFRLHQALQETKFQGRHGLSGRDLQALALRWEIPGSQREKVVAKFNQRSSLKMQNFKGELRRPCERNIVGNDPLFEKKPYLLAEGIGWTATSKRWGWVLIFLLVVGLKILGLVWKGACFFSCSAIWCYSCWWWWWWIGKRYEDNNMRWSYQPMKVKLAKCTTLRFQVSPNNFRTVELGKFHHDLKIRRLVTPKGDEK